MYCLSFFDTEKKRTKENLMELSIALAQILGVYLFVMGASMIIIPDKTRPVMKDFVQSKSMLLFSGYLSILIGMVIIHLHNDWYKDWTLLITLVGWAILINGFFRVFFTDSFSKKLKHLLTGEKYYWLGWALLVLGAYLGGMGFFS